MEIISKKRKISDEDYESNPQIKREIIRLIIQTLFDSGLEKSAELLENESGVNLESSEAKEFRKGVLSGSWDQVSLLVPSFSIEPKNEKKIKLCLKEQKYLEQISLGGYREALDTLRNEVTPLHEDPKNLHQLASLLLCNNPEELQQSSEWENDRTKILKKVQKFIPPEIMIPAYRLNILLNQAQEYQVIKCQKHCGFYQTETLLQDHSCEHFQLPEKSSKVLKESNEVWDLVCSHSGGQIAAIVKNTHFSVWSLDSCEKTVSVNGEAIGVCWSLDDKLIASGNSTGLVSVWCAVQGTLQYTLKDHTEKVTSCIWISHTHLLTGGIDRKLILWDNKVKIKTWELRVRQIEKSQDNKVVAVLNASRNEVMVMGNSPIEKISLIKEDEPITSIALNKLGTEVLVVLSLTDPKIKLWTSSGALIKTFSGFKQEKFILRPSFAGPTEDILFIGGEDGRIISWSKNQGTELGVLNSHSSTVNCVVSSPRSPHIIISGSDDNTIQIWNLLPH